VSKAQVEMVSAGEVAAALGMTRGGVRSKIIRGLLLGELVEDDYGQKTYQIPKSEIARYQKEHPFQTETARQAVIKPSLPKSVKLPKLTMEHLESAMRPPNGCPVFKFVAKLDDESQKILTTALDMEKAEMSAAAIRQMLLDAGFQSFEVPGVENIQSHRVGRRPCRCRD
jgi:hypothetical protein